MMLQPALPSTRAKLAEDATALPGGTTMDVAGWLRAPAVQADLDGKRTPALDARMHEAEQRMDLIVLEIQRCL
jgi:predicted transcriptional regulator